jgi:hypothetical protein
VTRRHFLIVIAVALAAYIVWDRLEARWLAEDIAAIAARGEPTALDAGLPQPKNDEQREAADLYAQAAATALESNDNGRAARIDVEKPGGGVELSLDDIRANYPDSSPELQIVDRATPLDFAGFTAEEREGDSYAQSTLENGLYALAARACLRADLTSLGGNGEAAARALVPCIRLKRTVTMSQYRAGIAQRILGSLRILLRHTTPSDAALAAVQQALESWPDADGTAGDLMRDRARLIQMSRLPIYPGVMFMVGRVVLHPWALRSARRAVDRFATAIAVARQRWADRWGFFAEQQRVRLQRRQRQRPALIGNLQDPFEPFTPYNPYVLAASAYEIATRHLVAGVLTVERYRRAHAGALPPAVDLSEDPFSGRPLVFKKDADGYALYSVDLNRQDDGGVLYGLGAMGLRAVGQQTPRDYGIRVPLHPNPVSPLVVK